MKRFQSIAIVTILVVGLGVGAWRLAGLDSVVPDHGPTVARPDGSGFPSLLTDPDSLLGALGDRKRERVWVSLEGGPRREPALTVTGTPRGAIVEFELHGYDTETLFAAGRRLCRPTVPGLEPLREVGLPEVPVLGVTLRLPGSGAAQVRVLEHRVRDAAVDPLAPSRGHLDRRDPARTPRVFSEFYSSDGVWPAGPVQLGAPFLLRDHRGVNLRLQPLRYDAGTGRLRITERLVVEIVADGPGGRAKAAGPIAGTAEFRGTLDRMFHNPGRPAFAGKAASGADRGRMLIITDPDFVDELAPFVTWKRRLGIEPVVVTTAETGASSAAIRSAIQARFDEPESVTWLILVGDRALVPPLTGLYDASDSDTRYALLSGDDLYPDVYVSRISADTLAQLAVQLAKFIRYEQRPVPGGAVPWYSRATGVASDEGDPADYERLEALRTELLGYGYHTVDRIYQNLGGTANGLRTALQDGTGLVNYLGHGTGTGWSSIPFDNSDIAVLDADGSTPWIVDVSCSNGDFALDDCFAENWLQAGSVSISGGAIGVVSATSDAPWVPPAVMQAEITDLLIGGGEASLGALFLGGLVKVLDLYAGLPVATRVLEQNVLFGDCSLLLRTREPGTFTVELPAAPSAADASWTVLVGDPGGPPLTGVIATITDDDHLYGLGTASTDGTIEIVLEKSVAGLDEIILTVSGPDRTPYLGVIALDSGALTALEPEEPGESGSVAPAASRLLGNHPNPFNPLTRIVFELPREQRVRLTVFDIRGRRVVRLLDEIVPAGRHEELWGANDDRGGPVASGVYLYRLETEDGALTGRMTLTR